MAVFRDSVETVVSISDESAAELRRLEQDRRELAERERARSREQENAARNLVRVNAEIRQAELRAEGRDLDARLDAVRRNYAAQIRAARSAGNEELTVRLRTLARIQQSELRAASDSGASSNFERQNARRLQAAREVARVETAIREASLRDQGKFLEADLVRTRASFAERIRAARAADNAELASRLRTQAQIEQSRARRSAAGRVVGDFERQNAQRIQAARETARAETDIREAGLRRQGQALQADLLRIRVSFAERIRQARAADNAELASRLRTLSQIRQAEARDAAERAQEQARRVRTQAAASAFTARLGVVGAFAAGAELLSGATDTISAAIRGDFEAAAERLQQIPVFGSVARAANTLLGEFSGINAEIRQINALEEKRTAEIERRQELIEASRAFETQIDGLRQQVALQGLATDEERELARIAEQRRVTEQEIVAAAAARGGIGRENAEQEARALANAIQAQQVAEVRARIDEQRAERARAVAEVEAEITDLQLRGVGRVLDAELAANRRVFEERARQAQADGNDQLAQRLEALSRVRERQIRDEEAQRVAERAREVAQVEAEVEDLQLRRAGRVLDAELAANRRSFADRIRLARESNNTQLADTLARLEAERAAELRLADARRQTQERRPGEDFEPAGNPIRQGIDDLTQAIEQLRNRREAPPEVTLDSDRFLTGVRDQSQAQDRAITEGVDRQIAAAEAQIRILERLAASQTAVAAALQNGTPVLVGGITRG